VSKLGTVLFNCPGTSRGFFTSVLPARNRTQSEKKLKRKSEVSVYKLEQKYPEHQKQGYSGEVSICKCK